MLQDHTRTSTYQSAFFQNYPDFAGKVCVLHVSTLVVPYTYLEILVTFLIWWFGSQDQNGQVSVTKFT